MINRLTIDHSIIELLRNNMRFNLIEFNFPLIFGVYPVSTTLARVGGAGFRQLAKFHHAAAIAYPNAPAPDLTAGFALSFLACYAPASGMLYRMRQPTSGVGPTCANSN